MKKIVVQLPSFEIATPEGPVSVAASVEYDRTHSPIVLNLEAEGASGTLGLAPHNRGQWLSSKGEPLPWLQKRLRMGAAGAAARRDLGSLARMIMHA